MGNGGLGAWCRSGVSPAIFVGRPCFALSLSLFVVSLGYASFAAAEPDDADGAVEGRDARAYGSSLSQLSLDELLQVRVDTTSKVSESIDNSPGVVSVVRMSDMEALGVRTISEALNYVPGVRVLEGGVGNLVVTIRGIGETFNQKVLFLIDGNPSYTTSHSDIPLLGIPVTMVDRIEVIRGPGAVIYGTNASAGVINVVTKKAKNRSSATAWGGSHGRINLGGDLARPLGESGRYFVGANAQTMSGYDAFYPQTNLHRDHTSNDLYRVNGELRPLPTSGTVERKERFANVMGGIEYKDFRLTANFFLQSRQGLGQNLFLYMPVDAIYRGTLVHADYKLKLGKLEIIPYADHNIMFIDLHITNNRLLGFEPNLSSDGRRVAVMEGGEQAMTEKPWLRNFRTRLGTTARYTIVDDAKWNHHVNVFGGLDYEYRRNGRYNLTDSRENVYRVGQPSGSVYEASFFGQVDWSLWKVRMVLGGRYVHNEYAGHHLMPRAAIILRMTSNDSLKFLYAEGFNSPNLHQIFADLPNYVGNPNLRAELLDTYDFAYTRASSNQLLVVNAYYLETSRVMARQNTSIPGIQRSENLPGFHRSGVEVELQQTLDRLWIQSGAAYHHQGNRSIDYDTTSTITPLLMANFGMRYRITNALTVGWSDLLYGPSSSDPQVSPKRSLGVQNLMTIAASYTWNEYKFGLDIYNVLNETLRHPDLSLRIPAIPAGPGRSLYLSASYTAL